jgi:protein-S-isoprenylcysteine O-methyltransferase Ste14
MIISKGIILDHVYRFLIPAMWISWALYWWIKSINVKMTVRHQSFLARLVYILPLSAAVLLLSVPNLPFPFLHKQILPHTPWIFWLGAIITAGGLLFSIWARLHIGQNWSGTVTIKEDHELITTGPYTYVRHPIYSGLLLAFIGSATASGQVRGLFSVLLVFSSLWYKLRQEERWMREQFGDAYRMYSQRVAALVPFLF